MTERERKSKSIIEPCTSLLLASLQRNEKKPQIISLTQIIWFGSKRWQLEVAWLEQWRQFFCAGDWNLNIGCWIRDQTFSKDGPRQMLAQVGGRFFVTYWVVCSTPRALSPDALYSPDTLSPGTHCPQINYLWLNFSQGFFQKKYF